MDCPCWLCDLVLEEVVREALLEPDDLVLERERVRGSVVNSDDLVVAGDAV